MLNSSPKKQTVRSRVPNPRDRRKYRFFQRHDLFQSSELRKDNSNIVFEILHKNYEITMNELLLYLRIVNTV